jgi:hypothetical protein
MGDRRGPYVSGRYGAEPRPQKKIFKILILTLTLKNRIYKPTIKPAVKPIINHLLKELQYV